MRPSTAASHTASTSATACSRRATGPAPVESTAQHQPDLLLLDIGLPGLDGLEVCRRVRDFSSLPIIILTVKAAEADKVAGLDAGADDYLANPLGPPELLARVGAALRRARLAEAPDSPPIVRFGELSINYTRTRAPKSAAARSLLPARRPGIGCWHIRRSELAASYWPTSSWPPSGARSTATRTSTCGCTSPGCAATWSLTRITRATS